MHRDRQAYIHAHKHMHTDIQTHSAYTWRYIDTQIHLAAERQAHICIHTQEQPHAHTNTHEHRYTHVQRDRHIQVHTSTGSHIKYIMFMYSHTCYTYRPSYTHAQKHSHTQSTLTSPPKSLSTETHDARVSRNPSPDVLWGQCSCSQRCRSMESPTDMP